MALACRKKFKTDYAMATSGIAGPDGGTEAKPVGTVWIGLAGPNDEVIARKYIFLRDRFKNIHLSALLAMELLRRKILSYD